MESERERQVERGDRYIMYMCVRVCMHACMCVCMHVCMRVCVCLCVYLYPKLLNYSL